MDNKLRDIQCHMDRGETVRGGLLSCLFLSQELTLEEIYANMTEMLLAGVDTVSGLAFLSSPLAERGKSRWPFPVISYAFVPAGRLPHC